MDRDQKDRKARLTKLARRLAVTRQHVAASKPNTPPWLIREVGRLENELQAEFDQFANRHGDPS